jgi:hypothetical protein
MVQPRSDSRGQLLLIVAFGMLALLAIGAIVVDLGLSWMLRRHEQNAADPAAIAAARYIEEGDSAATRTKMNTAICFYSKENGFFSTDDVTCSSARASGQLQLFWPPVSGPFVARPEMLQVVINADHPSFFGQVLGRPVATVTTSAVAARESTSANSNALLALDPTTCAAGQLHGNGDITIQPATNPDTGAPYNGGYVQVNSNCSPSGSYDNACGNGSGAFKQGGNAGAEIIAPHIYIRGTCQVAGGTVSTPVTEGAPIAPDPLAGLHGPRQQDYPAGYCPVVQGQSLTYQLETPTRAGCSFSRNGMTATLTPGVYYGGWQFSGNGVNVKLQPGIYIIAGGGITVSGSATISTVGGDPITDPARVLIFSTDNTTDAGCNATLARCVQGQIQMTGQSGLKVWGLDSGPWKGLLMWQDPYGTNPTQPIRIVGQGSLDLAGTIYAPKALVTIEGNGATGGRAAIQIISWQWDVGGNGNLLMPYDPTELFHVTQQGLVD